ncbi:hypothetical protein FGRMN_9406 [Fusarium graminum]|nr:hypothetical protein FGRMN_9406 [Fusarium graminum]
MSRYRLLASEACRQLACQESDATPQHLDIISLQQQKRDQQYGDHLEELCNNLHQSWFSQSSMTSPMGTDRGQVHRKMTGFGVLRNTNLIWQIPTFSNNGIAIKQADLARRLWLIQRRPCMNSTKDIWARKEVQDWLNGTKSSVLCMAGNSQTLDHLEMFGIETVEKLKSQNVVLHLLSQLPDDVVGLAMHQKDDVFRQLATQALQSLNPLTTLHTISLFADMVELFNNGDRDGWLQVLPDVLDRLHPRTAIVIIINARILRSNFKWAESWPFEFAELIKKLKGKQRLKVMIITGRPVACGNDSIIKKMEVVHILNALVPSKRFNSSCPAVNPKESIDLVGNTGGSSNLGSNNSPETQVLSPSLASRAASPMNISIGSDNIRNIDDHESKTATTFDGTSKSRFEALETASVGALQASISDESTRSTEKWFEMLQRTTHEFMYRRDGQNSNPTMPVKIAVLDSGFAYTAAEDKRSLRPYYQRIKTFTNFIDGDLDSEAKTDPSGHGTAVAVQILKTSLGGVLYICRVVRPDGDSMAPDKTAVEKAIRKAAAKPDKDSTDGGGWGVDIINMSFGWPYNHHGIRKAIEFARQNGVHMFASTSNDGLLGPPNDILYPVRSDSVIAVDAADGHGEHARYAPSSSSQHSRGSRFSAPGLGITSPNTEKIWSGSSFACPIAAGVAALILEFARQSPLSKSPDIQTYLKEMPAMLSMLRLASSEKGPDGLKFLVPWKLIGKSGEERLMTGWYIIDELRKEYGLEVGTEVAQCFKMLQD